MYIDVQYAIRMLNDNHIILVPLDEYDNNNDAKWEKHKISI